MRPESSGTKLVKRGYLVFIGDERRYGWEFICYKKILTPKGSFIALLRYDGDSETYNLLKTKIRIFNPAGIQARVNESPVTLEELCRERWKTQTFQPHQVTPRTELPGSFQL